MASAEADVKVRPRLKIPLVQSCALRLQVSLLGKEGQSGVITTAGR